VRNKKVPPFGHRLSKLLASGFRPQNDVLVFAGLRAWYKAKSFSISYPERVLCIPPWADPEQFYWPVQQCSVLVIDTLACELEYIDQIAGCVFREEAQIVRSISQNFQLTTYHKEMS
jgi:hypothetical protein